MHLRQLAPALVVWLAACGGAQVAPERSAHACAVGSYVGTGLDEEGTRWEFSLELRDAGPDVVGAFEWRGSNGSLGSEQIRGSVDCTTGALEWQGESASGGSGDMIIVTAHYTGTFAADFGSFSGAWTGGIPGTLSGQRR